MSFLRSETIRFRPFAVHVDMFLFTFESKWNIFHFLSVFANFIVDLPSDMCKDTSLLLVVTITSQKCKYLKLACYYIACPCLPSTKLCCL